MATKPGLDEQYLSATNSSDLTLNPDRVCAPTHLIAAGLLGNRMGAALVHLRGEWDTASKPRKATDDEILARAAELPKRKGKTDVKRARAEALVSLAVAMRHRAHSMSGWLPALSIMGEWAVRRGVDVDLLSPALYHWLSPTCPVCDGHGQIRMDHAPVLGQQCTHCKGEGTWPRPLGAEKIQTWLKGCAGKARRERGEIVHSEFDPQDLADARKPRLGADTEESEEARAATAAHFAASMGRRRAPELP